LAKIDALRPYVPEYASSLAALTVKFAIHHPGVTTAISSMHVEEYARMNIAATCAWTWRCRGACHDGWHNHHHPCITIFVREELLTH
jgi:hypothetical protein